MTGHFDMIVIGAGPAGQKAAIQAAKAGRRAVIIEKSASAGGECVHRGTIPSKTLRETAAYLSGLKRRSGGALSVDDRAGVTVEALMRRQTDVRRAHETFISRQLDRNGVEVWHGRARFLSAHNVEVTGVDGGRRSASGDVIVVATGSRPRTPPNVPVDHEHVLDSDSILSLIYVPASLTVLGAGVIASEYASIFAALGVHVTMIDKGPRPLAFMDAEITDCFVKDFERRGSRFLPGREIEKVESDGLSTVRTTLKGGEELRTEKLLCALGRVAQVQGLGIEALGIGLTKQGYVAVDENYRTSVPHIYAAGDVIGPPALAATSMEQGRRAARHALGLPLDNSGRFTPVGIYTVPEMSSVGLGEVDAREGHAVVVGRAQYRELARGHISGDVEGLLKLVVDATDGKLLGAQIIGEGATEIVHLAQMALMAGMTYDVFIENIFNFPTLAEAYRVAALDVARQTARCSNGHGPGDLELGPARAA